MTAGRIKNPEKTSQIQKKIKGKVAIKYKIQLKSNI
jgi:hypothetical protein